MPDIRPDFGLKIFIHSVVISLLFLICAGRIEDLVVQSALTRWGDPAAEGGSSMLNSNNNMLLPPL
jgi:hypothetical protein